MRTSTILIGLVAIVAIAMVAYGLPTDDRTGWVIRDDKNTDGIHDDATDTMLVMSGIPQEIGNQGVGAQVSEASPAHIRAWFMTTGMDPYGGKCSDFDGQAGTLNFMARDDGPGGAVYRGIDRVAYDICETDPSWTWDIGDSTWEPGVYYIEIWTDGLYPPYECQDYQFYVEVV